LAKIGFNTQSWSFPFEIPHFNYHRDIIVIAMCVSQQVKTLVRMLGNTPSVHIAMQFWRWKYAANMRGNVKIRLIRAQALGLSETLSISLSLELGILQRDAHNPFEQLSEQSCRTAKAN